MTFVKFWEASLANLLGVVGLTRIMDAVDDGVVGLFPFAGDWWERGRGSRDC